MGNIKKMISVILVVVCVFAFTACGKTETLDGKWVLVKSETSDGKDRKSTRLNSSHWNKSRMPSSA